MEYVLTKSFNSIYQAKVDEVLNKAKARVPFIVREIQREIYGAFVGIVGNTFLGIFDEYYGNNYDRESLMKSITYKQGNFLVPTFSYNQNQFVFINDIRFKGKEKNYFNQNAKQNSFINKNRSFENYQTGLLDTIWQDIEQIQDTGEETSTDDYLEELSDYGFFPVNNHSTDRLFCGLSEVYSLAAEKAISDFDREYQIRIKPRIERKYGVKI